MFPMMKYSYGTIRMKSS